MSGDRKLRKAERRLARAQERLDREQRVLEEGLGAEEADDGGGSAPGRGPGRKRLVVVMSVIAALLVAAGAVTAYLVYFAEDDEDETELRAHVSMGELEGFGEVVVVEGGKATLDSLADDPALAGTGLVTRAEDDTFVLGRTLYLRPTGKLEIEEQRLRLRSDPEGFAGIVVSGDLVIRRSTITSWNAAAGGPDAEIDDGRAYVITRPGGSTTIDRSHVVALGYDEPDRLGLTWTGPQADGAVTGSTIRNGYVGLSLQGDLPGLTIRGNQISQNELANAEIITASNLEIAGNSFVLGGGNGLLLKGTSSGVTIRDNEVSDNGSAGIAVLGAAADVVIDDSRLHGNGGAGLLIANARGVSLRNSFLWGNRSGVQLGGPASGIDIRSNRIASNQGAGVEVTSAGAGAVLTDNDVDHNTWGVLVVDGSIDIVSSRIVGNGVGLDVRDETPTVRVHDSDLDANHGWGIRLVQPIGITLAGNSILDNAEGAFLVPETGDADGFLADNEVSRGRRGVEAVATATISAEDVVTLEPVPAYFFGPPGEEFNELEQGTTP